MDGEAFPTLISLEEVVGSDGRKKRRRTDAGAVGDDQGVASAASGTPQAKHVLRVVTCDPAERVAELEASLNEKRPPPSNFVAAPTTLTWQLRPNAYALFVVIDTEKTQVVANLIAEMTLKLAGACAQVFVFCHKDVHELRLLKKLSPPNSDVHFTIARLRGRLKVRRNRLCFFCVDVPFWSRICTMATMPHWRWQRFST